MKSPRAKKRAKAKARKQEAKANAEKESQAASQKGGAKGGSKGATKSAPKSEAKPPVHKQPKYPAEEHPIIQEKMKDPRNSGRCRFFNSSVGCYAGDGCKFTHACMGCGDTAHGLYTCRRK